MSIVYNDLKLAEATRRSVYSLALKKSSLEQSPSPVQVIQQNLARTPIKEIVLSSKFLNILAIVPVLILAFLIGIFFGLRKPAPKAKTVLKPVVSSTLSTHKPHHLKKLLHPATPGSVDINLH